MHNDTRAWVGIELQMAARDRTFFHDWTVPTAPSALRAGTVVLTDPAEAPRRGQAASCEPEKQRPGLAWAEQPRASGPAALVFGVPGMDLGDAEQSVGSSMARMGTTPRALGQPTATALTRSYASTHRGAPMCVPERTNRPTVPRPGAGSARRTVNGAQHPNVDNLLRALVACARGHACNCASQSPSIPGKTPGTRGSE
jgi:hypothetical protein